MTAAEASLVDTVHQATPIVFAKKTRGSVGHRVFKPVTLFVEPKMTIGDCTVVGTCPTNTARTSA